MKKIRSVKIRVGSGWAVEKQPFLIFYFKPILVMFFENFFYCRGGTSVCAPEKTNDRKEKFTY
jgi:hypothetical protein